MLEQAKSIGGALSALAGAIAAVVAIIKTAEQAGHELPPILFSLGALVGGIFVFGLTVLCLVLAVREHDLEYIQIAAYEVPAVAAISWLAIEADLISVLFSGEYRSNSEWLIAAGAGVWAAIIYLVAWITVREVRARKDPAWAPRGRKLCPECAEYPKKAARICRHCGHRFAAAVQAQA